MLTVEERAVLLNYCLQAVGDRNDTIHDVEVWSAEHDPEGAYNYRLYQGYHAFKMMRNIEKGVEIARCEEDSTS